MGHVSQSRAAIRALYRADEAACVKRLLPRAELPRDAELRAGARARTLVEKVRRQEREAGGLDAFLLGTPDAKLPDEARRLKRAVKKAAAKASA